MADIDADAIWALSDALAIEPTTEQRTASAVVSRIDNDGTIWVRLAGAESATPVNGGCTVEVEPNDAVTVRIENGRCAITGSTSKPATNSAAVESRVAPVEDAAMDAKSEATAAKKIANEAASVAAATGQYFWHDANGAHVSIEAQNPTGASNSVWNSLGLLIRKAANNLVSITASAIAFFDGNGNADSNIVARFGSAGVQIGKSGESHIEQSADGMIFTNDNSASILEIGKTADSTYSGKISWAIYDGSSPFDYTLPWVVNSIAHVYGYQDNTLKTSDIKSNVSLLSDGRTIRINASGCTLLISNSCNRVRIVYSAQGEYPYFSLGENRIDNAGKFAALIGENNQSTGNTSTAIGESNRASGTNSIAAGKDCIANYDNAQAIGEGLITGGIYQHVVGRYNDNTNSSFFVVGNGTADDARSNAFAVAGNGTIYIGSNQLADFVVEQGTSGIWTYRKWNSGAAECWGIYTASIAITTSAPGYGGYRSAQITAPNFPFTFAATPTVTMNGSTGFNGCWVNNMQGTNATRAQFFLSCGQSNAATNRSVNIQAMGKWK